MPLMVFFTVTSKSISYHLVEWISERIYLIKCNLPTKGIRLDVASSNGKGVKEDILELLLKLDECLQLYI